jgi:hypothetical protein
LIILTAFSIFFSCENEDNDPAGLKGDLFGKVETFDEFGYPLPDHSGVKVTIEGTEPLLETMTDSSGNYSFEELKTGTYHLVFSKDDFQTRKIFSYQFIGGSVPTYLNTQVYLSEVSSTNINQFSISITDESDTLKYSTVKVEYAVSPLSTQEKPRRMQVYLSTSSEVSINRYDYRFNVGTMGSPEFIKLNKLPGNTTFYAIMYPVHGFCNPYYDPFTEEYDYSCYGAPTEVISFKTPK